ncbi:MAG: 23S rRNA (uracil(1939)-C(5))-methyltransferase RlmD, partial [Clostridia bacterium]|nr:23S rRNA (uracil(1939)-C(5))-methyltransferase RlmD [Clostridia bacterium]
MLQKNASWTAQIEELNSFGHGVTHADGMVVFVTGAVPGDVVRARVIKVARTYAVARAEEILTPSPVREKDACPARGCGGCIYGSVTYEAEREAKRAGVAAAFLRAGLPEVTVEEVVSPSPRLGYRNKAQYPVALTPAGEPVIGFFAPHTHRVVEAAGCPLQHPTFPKMLEIIRGFVKKHHIPIYDEATGQGLLRHICLRVGEATGEILCVLVLTRGELPHADELTADLRAAVPGLVGVVLNINPAATNVVFGERFVTLWGRDRLTDILCGLRLRVAAPAFYQVNRRAAEALYALAAERAALSPSDVLLDLFCGAGSIGLSMAG